MMETLFDTSPARPGYRLHRLEVYNWGTFDSTDGTIYRFEPSGRTSLLVGQNGSGKSTVVDALLTLLVPSTIRNYNVAAGSKKTERDERSYIRGAYGRGSDDNDTAVTKYLRSQGKQLTALLAVFTDEQLDRSFTICQVLYLGPDGSTEKIFALSDEARDLKNDLAAVHGSDSIRAHMQELGYHVTKKFVQYQEWFARRTQVRGKAMDMFNQTVAVKDIQSLNEFIRRHMLEAHDWRDKVQRLLTHFEELSTAHRELVRVRRAEELLIPVEKHGKRYQERVWDLTSAELQLEAADTFFREQTPRLYQPEVDRLEDELAHTMGSKQRIKDELKEVADRIRQIRNEIDEASGQRLRELPGLIKLEETRLEGKQKDHRTYHVHLRACGLADEIASADAFAEMREKLEKVGKTATKRLARIKQELEDALAERGRMRVNLRSEREELEILSQRKTNLPGHLATLRANMCADLQLAESDLPFAAELISVDPDESRWEASAEMVLRSFALSLLVPERVYRRVRGYAEATRLANARGEGQRLIYLRVGRGAPNAEAGDRQHRQSLLRKLRFRDGHELAPWVRGELRRRFDFTCCESIEEFNDVPRLALTANRHIKINSDHHEKDDRPRSVNPRHYVLGWDNQAKRRRLAESIESLKDQVEAAEQRVEKHERELELLVNRQLAAAAAQDYPEFNAIDIQRHRSEIASLQQEQEELESSNQTVHALHGRLNEAETKQTQLQDQFENKVKKEQSLSTMIQQAKQLVANAQNEIEKSRRSGHYELVARQFDSIADQLNSLQLTIENLLEVEQEWKKRTQLEVSRLRKTVEPLTEKLLEKMGRYLREFKEEQDDLSTSVHALESFLGLLNQIREEDLPRHEKRFKDRLNDKVSQEVALFNGALRRESKQIVGKIEQLNEALAQLEYHSGTHMRLEPRDVRDREIHDFQQSLVECLDESLENQDEANEARFLRIERLVTRLGDRDNTRWRDKVIDVRRWYDFAAREVETDTGSTRSYYEDSSGQSGGEKAKLAFTILVAAIAYQYDLDPTGNTPGRFHFVVVDEMFSKIDDRYAEYALKLFEQFGLQLLIVAPLDAKARVTEPFVDCYLHVVKDEKTDLSQMYSMTAREYEEVVGELVGGEMSSLPPERYAK